MMFLDPPYYLESKSRLYGDRGDHHQGFDHEGLYRAVKRSGVPFVATYNDHPHVRDMWDEYTIEPAEWSYGMNASKKSSEIIIHNQ